MIARRVILALMVLAFAYALAACDSGSGSTPTPVPPPTNPPMAQPGTIILFETTGGVAGAHDKLEINPQGGAKLVSTKANKKQTLPAATYTALLQQIDKADFYNLKASYNSGSIADAFVYTVTVTKDGHPTKVQMAEAGGKDVAPQPLKDLITQLKDIQAIMEK